MLRPALPGERPRQAPVEHDPAPRTAREMHTILGQLGAQARIAAAAAICDVIPPLWERWLSRSSVQPEGPLVDYPERIGWLLRGWLVAEVPDLPVLEALRMQGTRALIYIQDRWLEDEQGSQVGEWEGVMTGCSGLPYAVIIGPEVVQVDAGTLARQATQLFGRLPSEEGERWMARWWGRFRALWAVAHPVWKQLR